MKDFIENLTDTGIQISTVLSIFSKEKSGKFWRKKKLFHLKANIF